MNSLKISKTLRALRFNLERCHQERARAAVQKQITALERDQRRFALLVSKTDDYKHAVQKLAA